jgi:hypothetical protein
MEWIFIDLLIGMFDLPVIQVSLSDVVRPMPPAAEANQELSFKTVAES